MRRWWSVAGGLSRRVLSSSSSSAAASRSCPLPAPVISRAPSAPFPFAFAFAFAFRRHYSLHAPLPQVFFNPGTIPAFRPPVSSLLLYSSLFCWPLPEVRFGPIDIHFSCRAVVGAAAAGAALRQEGQKSARTAHAHQLQSQEIQAQGPFVIAYSSLTFPFHIHEVKFRSSSTINCCCCLSGP
jgi:hypothetical protein